MSAINGQTNWQIERRDKAASGLQLTAKDWLFTYSKPMQGSDFVVLNRTFGNTCRTIGCQTELQRKGVLLPTGGNFL